MKAINEQAEAHAQGVHRSGRYRLLARPDGTYTVVRMDRQGFMPQRFVGDAMSIHHAQQLIDEAGISIGGVRLRTIMAASAVAVGAVCLVSAIWLTLGWKVLLGLAVLAIGLCVAAVAIWMHGIIRSLNNIGWTPH